MSRMSWSARVIVGMTLGVVAGCAGRTNSEGGLGTGGAGASANAGVGGNHQTLGGSGGTTHGGSSGTTQGGSSGTTHGGSAGVGGAPPNDCHGLGQLTQDPRCDACLLGPCCEATDGCFNDKACFDLLQCVSKASDCSGRPDEQRCYQERCGQFYSRDAIDRLNGFGTCYEDTCGTACSSEPNDCMQLSRSFGDPRCDQCLKGQCCDAIFTCIGQPGCDALRECVAKNFGCEGTQYPEDCYRKQCGKLYTPEAMKAVNVLRECSGSSCGRECGGTEPNWCEPDLCPNNGRGSPCCMGPDGPCGFDRGNGCRPSGPPG